MAILPEDSRFRRRAHCGTMTFPSGRPPVAVDVISARGLIRNAAISGRAIPHCVTIVWIRMSSL
ncbi:hypothetical protein BOSEA31B_13332 [Hyphomicrobiales bacterium]|nr:hypothetical protein BOSEA31B_13332 [Hyphomicrobiales bacterium]CAH1699104.1 hypothetical protein BOSEA1005_12157 [Hyphomicrobiales bacterium]CAI0342894.1 hypothetical protein BO1005MUT1_200039 [Hyphomicrobiales bacterium]